MEPNLPTEHSPNKRPSYRPRLVVNLMRAGCPCSARSVVQTREIFASYLPCHSFARRLSLKEMEGGRVKEALISPSRAPCF